MKPEALMQACPLRDKSMWNARSVRRALPLVSGKKPAAVGEVWKGLVERSWDAEAFLGTAAKAHLPTVWIVEASRPWQIVARVKMLSNFFQTVFYWAEM